MNVTKALATGIAALAFAAPALAATATLTAAPAHANPPTPSEVYYVKELADAGVPGQPDQLITNGHVVCQAMDTGTELASVIAQAAPRAGVSMPQMGFLAGAAIRWLCPGESWQIGEFHHADQSIPGVTAAIAGYGS
jgi:hypothetical protein